MPAKIAHTFAFALTSVALASLLASAPAAAQSADAARNAAKQALQNNPEVTARLNAYLGKVEAQAVASAPWKPRVDLNANVGAGSTRDRGGLTRDLDRAGVGLTLTQVLWDGFATRHDVSRVGHESLSRWFELVETSEQTALEATRAVYDVQRLRKLVALAEDNLLQHQQASAKLDERFKAGVGRGVDLDQARARLALAESNRDTELANLHDVAARYQRIVGEQPPADMGSIELLRAGMPGSAPEAAQMAISRSPAVAATIENLRAARAGESNRRSAFQPQVSVRAHATGGRNLADMDGRKSDAGVELLMNWNLYNGGADSARVREQQYAVQQAQDLRDQACRDVRQTVLIAYNDTAKLVSQLGSLGRNSAAIERARDAYRQQFDIGQRSLLDLLNAENEAYTARRSLTNAVYDRALAYARTLAATSQLTTRLNLSRDLMPGDAQNWAAGEDVAMRCPAQAVDLAPLKGGDTSLPLDATGQAAPTERPAVASAMPVQLPGALVSLPLTDAAPAAGVDQRLKAWAKTWASRDVAQLSAFYAPDFKGGAASVAAWRHQQRLLLAGKTDVALEIEELQIKPLADGSVETRFVQSLLSNKGAEVKGTALTWRQVQGQWHIVQERKV